MPERHTVVFQRCHFNVITDHDRRTITLQFEESDPFLEIVLGRDGRPIKPRRSPSVGGLARMLSNRPIDRILRALDRRFDNGLAGWLSRWRTGGESPLVLAAKAEVHPENPDVVCFRIGVKANHPTDAALAALLSYIRTLPGYQQTFGDPLDRDITERGTGWGPNSRSRIKGNKRTRCIERRRRFRPVLRFKLVRLRGEVSRSSPSGPRVCRRGC